MLNKKQATGQGSLKPAGTPAPRFSAMQRVTMASALGGGQQGRVQLR